MLKGLLERAGETRGRVRICLDRDEALLRRVTMPAATEENLRQVLAFEMDRLTPFRAEEVYFDCRVESREADGSRIGVELGVVRRELVDARLDTFRRWGASVQGVALRDDIGHGGSLLDLLPREQRGEEESGRERLVRLSLIGLVVALLFAALFVPALLKRETIKSMLPVIGKTKVEAEATDALGRELDKQVADYNFLLAKKHSIYPALAYLEEVSRLLPDQTWVQQFDFKTIGKTREVQVSGETNSSSKLIEILEQSTLLRNATQKGTLTRGSQPGLERFVIAAEVRPRTLPEAQPVVASVSLPGEQPVAAPALQPPPAAPLQHQPATESKPVAPAAPPPRQRPAIETKPAAPAAPPAPSKSAGEATPAPEDLGFGPFPTKPGENSRAAPAPTN